MKRNCGVRELQELRDSSVEDYLSAMKKLDERSDLVVSWLMAGQPAKEIAKQLDISVSRVHQIFHVAKTKIFHLVRVEKAEEEFKSWLKGEFGGDLEDLLSISWEALPLTVRTQHCLRAAAAKTVRDIVVRTEIDLLQLMNFGKKSLEELKRVLESLGLSLGMRLPKNIPLEEALRLTSDDLELLISSRHFLRSLAGGKPMPLRDLVVKSESDLLDRGIHGWNLDEIKFELSRLGLSLGTPL